MRNRPAVLALLAVGLSATSCAPTTQSLVLKDGRPTLAQGSLPLAPDRVAVILWAGTAGDDPEIASIDGIAIPSATTNNRLELAPGKHIFVFRAAWVPGDVQGGPMTMHGRWSHEKIDVTEEVTLEAGRCYFPKQQKTSQTTQVTSYVGSPLATSSGVSWATESAHLADASTDPHRFGSTNLCLRSNAR